VKSKTIQEGLYTKKVVNDKFTLYWRILSEIQEIEIVVKAKTKVIDFLNIKLIYILVFYIIPFYVSLFLSNT